VIDTGKQLKKRTLTAPVASDNAKKISLFYVKANILQCFLRLYTALAASPYYISKGLLNGARTFVWKHKVLADFIDSDGWLGFPFF
jgi:hypothetical protein